MVCGLALMEAVSVFTYKKAYRKILIDPKIMKNYGKIDMNYFVATI